VFIAHCNTAPFDNADLRMALKLAIDREDMLDKILRGYGSVGNDFPINAPIRCFPTIEQRKYDPTRPSSTSRNPAMTALYCCAHPMSPFRAPSMRHSSTSRARQRPASSSRSSASPATATGRKSGTSSPSATSYWGGRSTQDQMYSTAYLSTADWNDTRFKRGKFDKMVLAARAELDTEPSASRCTTTWR
jgi:peptide/nickel transport system substrate-binding protein